MPLYHFSEEPDICVFEPRTGRLPEAYIWAIDEWHAPMYYFPRDCPRACFWPGPQSTVEDRERWFGGIEAKMVIAVETAWLECIRSAKLFRYALPDDGFVLRDATAGHWVSRDAVTPVSVEPVGDLLAALADANVELRITPSLTELWSRVIVSTLEFPARVCATLRAGLRQASDSSRAAASPHSSRNVDGRSVVSIKCNCQCLHLPSVAK